MNSTTYILAVVSLMISFNLAMSNVISYCYSNIHKVTDQVTLDSSVLRVRIVELPKSKRIVMVYDGSVTLIK